MTQDSSEPVPLGFTRPMAVTSLIVMGIAILSALDRRPVDRHSGRPGYVFGYWSLPSVRPVNDESDSHAFLGAIVQPLDGVRYYRVDHPEDGRGPLHLAFVNSSAAIAGQLRRVDPDADSWPPTATDFRTMVDDFGNALQSDLEDGDLERLELSLGFRQDAPLWTETVDYPTDTLHAVDTENSRGSTPAATVEWTCMKQPDTWPLRIHLGRLRSGDLSLVIKIWEFDAQASRPNYRQGPIAEIVRAIRPE